MTTNILLCGVGGQGTVLASKLIAEAAMRRGLCGEDGRNDRYGAKRRLRCEPRADRA